MPRQIPWLRIVAEGFAIVVSILLAFGIQAWWDAVQDAEVRRVELDNLRSDFQAAKADLEEKRFFHGLISSSLGQMLAELGAAAPGERVAFPDTLIIAAMVNPTLDVATTHEELDMSASISSIENRDLRAAVVDWPRVVRDAVLTEEIATRVTGEQLMPRLSESGDLADAWSLNVYWSTRHQAGLPLDRPIKDISIVNSLQLRNDLAQRIRHEDVIVAMIDRSIQHVDQILSLIDPEG